MAIEAALSGVHSVIGSAVLTASLIGLFACSSQTSHSTHETVSPTPRSDTLHISAVGDIMLGGTAEPVLQQYGYDYPFEQVKYLFDDSDIVIGNLEGPLTDREIPWSEDKQYVFRSPPDRVAPALRKAGFTLLNLANNHIMDFGPGGLKDTLRALQEAGIATVGAGNNLQEARQGTLIRIREHTIGFLSYSLTFPKSFWADAERPGAAFGHEHQIRQDIQRMNRVADLVVVSYHWGREKQSELREYQPTLAHAAIDEGASLVIGHHPHVLQAVERYKHGLILYSLGNFTFGSYSRDADNSVIARITFEDRRFHSLRLVPLNVLNVEVNFQPRVLTGDAADRVFSHLSHLSEQQNTRLNIDKGVAFLRNTTSMSHSGTILD